MNRAHSVGFLAEVASLVARVRALPRGRVVDAVLALAVVLVVTAALAAEVGGQRQPDVFAYLFAGGLGALMFVRRQFPVLALMTTAIGLCAYYTAGYPAIGLALPVAAALYSTAEAGRLRWAVWTAAGLVTAASYFRVLDGVDLGYYFGYELASTVGVMAGAIAIGDGVRARRLWHAEQALRERQAEIEREQEAERRVDEERVRIARDLHDVLAHHVSVITLHSGVAAEALADDTDAARTALHNVQAASGDAMRELRNTVRLLREPAEVTPRQPVTGLDELDRLVDSMASSGLAVQVRVDGEPAALPVTVDSTAYRIIQESLTNTLRHAHATRAEVLVRYTPAELHVGVSDDGHGADPGQAATGHGLRGMKERAAALGGSVQAHNRAEGGFRVEARLPLEEA